MFTPTSIAQNWTQLGVDILGEASGDNSGDAVAVSQDGQIVAIGAPTNDAGGTDAGHVRVFQWNGSSWVQMGADIDGLMSNERAGFSVALSDSGFVLAVGCPRHPGFFGSPQPGQIRIYEWINNTWIQKGNAIDGPNDGGAGNYISLSSDGNTVAFGADRFSNTGAVEVYEFISGTWVQKGATILGPPLPLAGTLGGLLGYTVNLSDNGDIIAVSTGVINNPLGYVRVFEFSNNTWTQVGQDFLGDSPGIDNLAYDVSLSGDGSRVALSFLDNLNFRILTQVFENQGGNWVQIGQSLLGQVSSGSLLGLGVSISNDGNRLALSDPGDSTNGNNTGSIEIYELQNNNWTQVGQDILGSISNAAFGEYNRLELSGDGNTVIFGSGNVNRTRIFSYLTSNQICPPPGDLIFNYQNEIDQFILDYPSCTQIDGNVIIQDIDPNDNINNLQGLQNLQVINGNLFILDNTNANLTDLTGLDDLMTINGGLKIDGNTTLQNLNGLNSLSSVGGAMLIENNAALNDMTDLNGLMGINGSLRVKDNTSLTSLLGLENIDYTTITTLTIKDNQNSLVACQVQSVCDFLDNNPLNLSTISNNATNNGCNTVQQVQSACNCPGGNLIFKSQTEVDNFPTLYPNCSDFSGNLIVDEDPSLADPIVDLCPLQQLVTIGGNVEIKTNPDLSQTTCILGLTEIGGNFLYQQNGGISDMVPFGLMESVGGNVIFQSNNDLTSFIGWDQITDIGGALIIRLNPDLQSTDGTFSLQTIGSDLTIAFNNNMINAGDFTNTTNVDGRVLIFGNNAMQEISLLPSLTGDPFFIFISGNAALTTISGFTNLNTFTGSIIINDNDLLTDMNGFNNLTNIGGLRIQNNDLLADLDGFSGLASISGSMQLKKNSMLGDISGLTNLLLIDGNLDVQDNDQLTTLNGLDNLNPTALDFVKIEKNNILNVCDVQSVCDFLQISSNHNPTPKYSIKKNATDCDNVQEVLISCGTICPTSAIIIDSQQDIEDFFWMYPGCTDLPVNVTIQEAIPGDIVNLAGNNGYGLSQIEIIQGLLRIKDNISLPDLNGLHNLEEVGGVFNFDGNDAVQNLNDLQALTTFGGSIGIENNDMLTSLALPGGNTYPSTLNGYLNVCCNAPLTDLSGLEDIQTVMSYIRIIIHPNLMDLTGLENVTYVDDFFEIRGNTALTTLGAGASPLSLSEVGGKVEIDDNPLLTNLNGISNLTQIGQNATAPGGRGISMFNNDALTDITVFSGLTNFYGYIDIRSNLMLPSLSGLDNIDENNIIGNATVPNGLVLEDNAALNICDVTSICDYIDLYGGSPPGSVFGNATNCVSFAVIDAECAIPFDGNPLQLQAEGHPSGFSFYPNPAQTSIIIDLTNYIDQSIQLRLTNKMGQEIWFYKATAQEVPIMELSFQTIGLRQKGTYFIELQSDTEVLTKKLVVLD